MVAHSPLEPIIEMVALFYNSYNVRLEPHEPLWILTFTSWKTGVYWTTIQVLYQQSSNFELLIKKSNTKWFNVSVFVILLQCTSNQYHATNSTHVYCNVIVFFFFLSTEMNLSGFWSWTLFKEPSCHFSSAPQQLLVLWPLWHMC